ncbi:endonuclease NucS domain-containing protein [Deinococcus oregonensis]|uniref:Endonuclease NucS domain-containing protein n=1 Tax=Deinococcus oregonensis TaxID=1805970 RepID=A0ABV6B4N0_9DEIO
MQETLAAHPELIEPGLRVLNRELLVESGGIDLYAQDAQGRFVVAGLKRGRATQDAVSQLGRYVASVQRVMGASVVRGILAAPSITGPARRELEGRGLEFVEVGALPVLEKSSTQPSLF